MPHAKGPRLLVTLLLACGAVQASEWVSVSHSTDGADELFVDVSSIRVINGIRRAWDKWVPARQTVKGAGENSHRWVSYELGRSAFNCGEETSKIQALTIYYADGTNEHIAPEVFKSWEPVVPDSVYGFEMQYVCAWKPK